MKKIVMLCLSAGIQKTICFESFVPGEVNRSKSYRFDASGKAINSARVLMQLVGETRSDVANSSAVRKDSSASVASSSADVSVSIVCPLGERNKDFFLEMAAADSLNVRCVPIPGFTRECCTLLDEKSGQATELVVEEPVPTVDSTPYEEKLMELFAAELGISNDCKVGERNGLTSGGIENADCGGVSCAARITDSPCKADALLFSGSRPKFWSAGLIKRIAAMAKENGILFMADFRGNDLLSILDEYTPDIIKINEDEFWATFGINSPATFVRESPAIFGSDSTNGADCVASGKENADGTIDEGCTSSASDHEERLSAAIAEKSRMLNNIIVVTRGSKKTLAAEKGKPYHSMSERVKAVNTIGCGDAFNAGFLYEYLITKDMQKSLEKGKWCASRNAECLRPGVLQD